MAIIYLRKQYMDNNLDNTGGNKDLAENGIVVTEAMIEAASISLCENFSCQLGEQFGPNPLSIRLLLLDVLRAARR